MSPERIEELYADFNRALKKLEEALHENKAKGEILIDATIQRFEFTFELAWKLAKNILGYNGIEANSPREAIKGAFKTKIITDGQGWIDMLVDRNKTSHIYDEDEAKKIYKNIKERHFPLLVELKEKTGAFLKKDQ